MTSVHVLSKIGKPLMPTIRFGRVSRPLKSGKAVIVKHEPFTIQLTYDTPEIVQPVEVCVDAGYAHIGVSIKSEKREYESAQYDLLPDEKKSHDDCRAYRRTRRNRLRYRATRFNNRDKPKGWFAPSIRNKYECHLRIIEKIVETTPMTRIIIETAQFDTQLLEAIEQGLLIPEGTDYQHGERYGIETLRKEPKRNIIRNAGGIIVFSKSFTMRNTLTTVMGVLKPPTAKASGSPCPFLMKKFQVRSELIN